MNSICESDLMGEAHQGQNILTTWKDIARYVGKGVRTVQRWEQEFGFPVRRASGHGRHAVLAIPDEINAWARCQNGTGQSELQRLRDEVERLEAELEYYRPRSMLHVRPSPDQRPTYVQSIEGMEVLRKSAEEMAARAKQMTESARVLREKNIQAHEDAKLKRCKLA